MGIPDHSKNTHWKNTVPTCIWNRSCHSRRSGAHELLGGELRRRYEQKGYAPPARSTDEVRAIAEQRLARYQNLMAKYYNNKVRHRDFQVGDLVLQKVMGASRDPSQGKLSPNWEGPYRIASWQKKGTYHLETMDGQKLQHPWNTKHLRKYYP